MSTVSIRKSGSIAELVLHHPPLNVIDLATAAELESAIASLARGRGLNAVVVRSEERAFCAGVDVRDHLPNRGREMIRAFNRVCLALNRIETPVIAAVRGAALGGGCELALVCDLVLAAESATFGLPEIRLGVFPPVAAILLPRLVGARRAADLVLTGRTLSAHEAERAGIASRVVADDEFDAALETLLIELRALSAPALRVAKRALRFAGGSLTSEEIAEAEAIYMNERLKAPDAIEGLEAFLEKRAPRWAGGS